jgi:hypothetical protein
MPQSSSARGLLPSRPAAVRAGAPRARRARSQQQGAATAVSSD